MTRKLILHPEIILSSPNFVTEEIKKYNDMLLSRSKLSADSYNFLLKRIYNNISLIEDEHIINCLEKADELIGSRDKKDIPFLAAALCNDVDGIWSSDEDYDEQNIVTRYTTSELYELFII